MNDEITPVEKSESEPIINEKPRTIRAGVILEEAICPKCVEGNLVWSCMTLEDEGSPIKYTHRCTKCGYEVTYEDDYYPRFVNAYTGKVIELP